MLSATRRTSRMSVVITSSSSVDTLLSAVSMPRSPLLAVLVSDNGTGNVGSPTPLPANTCASATAPFPLLSAD
jgi:hypothetical protein